MIAADRLSGLSLGGLATGLPGAAGVLRRCGLPACTAPDRPLAAAAEEAGIPLAAVVGALEDLLAAERFEAALPTDELILHIVERYHRCHRSELVTLRHLAGHLAAEGPAQALLDLLDGLRLAMEEHMRKEELRVFPMMTRGGRDRLAEWIDQLRREHEDAATYLLELESLTDGFRAPPDACGIRSHLYLQLERLADEIVIHIYLEEHLLFPRFLH